MKGGSHHRSSGVVCVYRQVLRTSEADPQPVFGEITNPGVGREREAGPCPSLAADRRRVQFLSFDSLQSQTPTHRAPLHLLLRGVARPPEEKS